MSFGDKIKSLGLLSQGLAGKRSQDVRPFTDPNVYIDDTPLPTKITEFYLRRLPDGSPQVISHENIGLDLRAQLAIEIVKNCEGLLFDDDPGMVADRACELANALINKFHKAGWTTQIPKFAVATAIVNPPQPPSQNDIGSAPEEELGISK